MNGPFAGDNQLQQPSWQMGVSQFAAMPRPVVKPDKRP